MTTIEDPVHPAAGVDLEHFERAAQKVCEAGFEALVRYHHRHGPGMVAHAPGGAMAGVAVRLHDQVVLLANVLYRGPTTDGFDRQVSDHLFEIVLLATIGQLVAQGEWPGTAQE